jgi:hypothetical protein
VRTHGKPSTFRAGCDCPECYAADRERGTERNRRSRARRRPQNVPCLICDEWFATVGGRNCHETKVHG